MKKTKNNELSILTKKHEGKWVALSNDRKSVLAVGNSLESILRETKGLDKIVLKVIPRLNYAPSMF